MKSYHSYKLRVHRVYSQIKKKKKGTMKFTQNQMIQLAAIKRSFPVNCSSKIQMKPPN